MTMPHYRVYLLVLLNAAILIPASSQTYSPLYAPSSSVQLTATCVVGGVYVPNCLLDITTGYYTNSIHNHSSPAPPVSTPSPSSGNTDAYGQLPVTLTTTIVAQPEWIQVCPHYGGICHTYDYAVGLTIYWAGDHGIWTFNGARAIHGNSVSFNHWVTTNAGYGLYYSTLAYQATYPGLVLSNDMSLPYGGIFDLNANWITPHITHGYGTAGDMNGITDPTLFEANCSLQNAIEVLNEPGPNDVHCRWAN